MILNCPCLHIDLHLSSEGCRLLFSLLSKIELSKLSHSVELCRPRLLRGDQHLDVYLVYTWIDLLYFYRIESLTTHARY